jgi:hypothetical protein
MDAENCELAAGLVSRVYITQGAQALAARRKKVKALLSNRRLPPKGWDEATIEMLLQVGLTRTLWRCVYQGFLRFGGCGFCGWDWPQPGAIPHQSPALAPRWSHAMRQAQPATGQQQPTQPQPTHLKRTPP